jgi:hypothetical protein
MEMLKDIIARQQDGRFASDDPLVERLIAELLVLAEEVCVLRDRLDACEKLSRDGKVADMSAIDAYKRDSDSIERQLESHKAFFNDVFARITLPR